MNGTSHVSNTRHFISEIRKRIILLEGSQTSPFRPDHKAMTCRMVGRSMIDQLDRTWEEVVVAWLEILFWYFSGGTKGNNKIVDFPVEFRTRRLQNISQKIYTVWVSVAGKKAAISRAKKGSSSC